MKQPSDTAATLSLAGLIIALAALALFLAFGPGGGA